MAGSSSSTSSDLLQVGVDDLLLDDFHFALLSVSDEEAAEVSSFPISDDKYAQLLWFQEALMSSLLIIANHFHQGAPPIISCSSSKNEENSSANTSHDNNKKMKAVDITHISQEEAAAVAGDSSPLIIANHSSHQRAPPVIIGCSSSKNEENNSTNISHDSNKKMKAVQNINHIIGEEEDSSLSFCGICMYGKPRDKMLMMRKISKCSHTFCSECVSNHIVAKIEENINMVTCPGLNCSEMLEPHMCRAIIPEQVFDRWENALCESVFLDSQKIYCPFNDCLSMLLNDGEELIRETECPHCRRLFCVQCKVPWHSEMGCDDFQRLKKDERGQEDLMLMNLANHSHQGAPIIGVSSSKNEENNSSNTSHDNNKKMKAVDINHIGEEEAGDSSLFMIANRSHPGAPIFGVSSSKNEENNSSNTSHDNNKKMKAVDINHIGEEEEEAAGDSSLSFCGICMDGKPRDEMLTMRNINKCSHTFCSECVSNHIAAKIEENITMVTCPGLNCSEMLEPHMCRAIIPEQVFDRWENALCESVFLDSQKIYCPFNDCSSMLLNDGDELIRETECPHCRRLFCVQCKVPWHSEMGCDDFQRLKEDERGQEDLMLMSLAKKNKWRRCPNCEICVEKMDGCLHITCRCAFEFCYGCGAKWSQTHQAACVREA